MVKNTHVCGRCKRELPLEAFYGANRKTRLDNYCKECRKESSRKQRKKQSCRPVVEEPPHYIVLTEVQERSVRLMLILRARAIVRERVMNKCRKLREKNTDD